MPRYISSRNAQIAYFNSNEADFANLVWNVGAAKPTLKATLGAAIQGAPRRLAGVVPGRRLVADKLDGRRYTKDQNRLQRLGFLAAVDGDLLGERKRDRARRDRVLSIFQESGVFERGHIVGIQPIVYATANREQGSSLARRAKALSTSIEDAGKVGGETLFNPKPLVVGSQHMETTKAIYEAATDLEQKAQAHAGGRDGSYVPSSSLIVVMGAGHIALTLPGPSHDEVVRSGVVTPEAIDPLPKYTFWIPRFIPSPVRRPSAEFELPAPLEPAMVLQEGPPAAQPYTTVYS